MKNNKGISIAVIIGVCVLGVMFISKMKQRHIINELVARNIEARGGLTAWENVKSLRVTGRMDLGQDMSVPYVLEQKRPDKMCFEFVFDKKTALQCADGKKGWKIVPFMGNDAAQPMTDVEYREMADTADPYGLLYNYSDRGTDVEIIGHEKVGERDTIKLKLTLDKGAVRWIYLDAETALEIKMEAMRTIAKREQLVETYYSEWRTKYGLLIAHRQETKNAVDKNSHFLTVESVTLNPTIADSRFAMPTVNASSAAAAKKKA